jgi:hypothetical protein
VSAVRRLYRPPEPIAGAARRAGRFSLVRGEILSVLPPGARAVELPEEIRVDDPAAPPLALARVDVEELYNFGRPGLTTLEYGRDLFLSDGTGAALLHIAGDDGRLHPDVELHLGVPFVERPLEPPEGALTRTVFVRAVRVGDPLYVFGVARGEQDLTGVASAASYRDAATLAGFDAARRPLHLYDERAFRQLTAWHALPWYRKLSVLVRNR